MRPEASTRRDDGADVDESEDVRDGLERNVVQMQGTLHAK